MTITREQIEMYASAADATQTFEMDKGKLIAVEPEHMQELARMALAGMEAVPVAWRWNYGGTTSWRLQETKPNYGDNHKFPRVIQPLYDAPQPLTTSERAELENYRNAQQVVPSEKVIGTFNAEKNELALLDKNMTVEKFAHWHVHNSLEVIVRPSRTAMRPGAVKDGWVACSEANSALVMLDRIETTDPADDDRIDEVKRIIRELSQPRKNPQCWCRTCRPVKMNDMRFVVCPDCGNKRCPHANDHRNLCTGSNEPGQEGSAYPAAPQQEA